MLVNKYDSGMPWFSLQWHITAKCDQICRHCYMVNKKKIWLRELKNTLPLDKCYQIIDSLVDFCHVAKARPAITFTGGDPLLRKDFFEILSYARSKKVRCKLMGNPFHLSREIIIRMKEYGIGSYQLSIDGMEKYHDKCRMPGSFQATIRAIKLLNQCGMRSVIMFTLSSQNSSDLFEVMRLVSELGVSAFAFARYCCGLDDFGQTNGKGVNISPVEYRALLIKAQNLAENLKKGGSKTLFNQKDHLWKLLRYEQGKLELIPNQDQKEISGCSIGRSCLAVLADGTVYACRRFNSPIGKIPDQSVLDIFVSDNLDYYRQINKLEKCKKCPLLYYCRGCPAVAHSESNGNFFAPDPQCWRK